MTELNRTDVSVWFSCSVMFAGTAAKSLQLCPTLFDPMDCSPPGLPVHHQLTEFTQTHVHWVGDVIQPSYPLSSPSPPAFNLSQHQGLFKWASSSRQVVKYWSFNFNISPSNVLNTSISKIKRVQQKLSTIDWSGKQRKPKLISARTKLIKAQTGKQN